MLALKFLAASIFIITGGAVFTKWFKEHRVLAVLAALVSIAGAYYFLRDVVSDVVRQERREVQSEQPIDARAGNDEIKESPRENPPALGPADAAPPSSVPTLPIDPPEIGSSQTPRDISRGTTPPTESRPRARRVFDALSIEGLARPDQSALVFPTTFFNRRLQQELGAVSTPIPQIRLGVVFIEPRANRASARDGTVIGYFLVSLPNLPNCTRQFGGPSYAFPDANTGMMGAVNDAAPDIAHWIERASREEVLTCPD